MVEATRDIMVDSTPCLERATTTVAMLFMVETLACLGIAIIVMFMVEKFHVEEEQQQPL
jgi:hypothetical protein